MLGLGFRVLGLGFWVSALQDTGGEMGSWCRVGGGGGRAVGGLGGIPARDARRGSQHRKMKTADLNLKKNNKN